MDKTIVKCPICKAVGPRCRLEYHILDRHRDFSDAEIEAKMLEQEFDFLTD